MWENTDQKILRIWTLFAQRSTNPNKIKIYIGYLNPSIKEIDLVKLFGLSTTKYLRETCSLNMQMNDNTGQSKGYTLVSAPEHVCNQLLKLNKVTFYGSQVKIEEAKFKRGQTICCFITSLKSASSYQ